MAKPVVITCAPTGGIHTPTMSEHLPITPDQIAHYEWSVLPTPAETQARLNPKGVDCVNF